MAVVGEPRTFPAKVAAAALLVLAASLAGFAVWVHYPGHISMDSSMQVYESWLGESVTWNPPTMSAMLRWIGGGADAIPRAMGFNAWGTYLALAGTGALAVALRAGRTCPRGLLATALVALVLLNPILFIYVGIVWKDVVFSTFMLAGAALGLWSCMVGGRWAWVAALGAAVVLGLGLEVRQQGFFVAPVLLLAAIAGVNAGRALSWRRMALNAAIVVGTFVATILVLAQLVAATIHTPPQYGSQVGVQGVMQYDITGTVAFSRTPSEALPIEMDDTLRAEIRRVYSVDRGDFQWTSPMVADWLSAPGGCRKAQCPKGYEGVRERWTTLVTEETGAYLRHRMWAFRSLMNVDGVKACLPIHVGMDGMPDKLAAVGIAQGFDRYDHDLYGFAQKIIRWPVYRHWAYALALVVAGVVVLVAVRPSPVKWGLYATGVATALLYASYLPTTIACDFRYLFPATCLVSLVWIVLAAELTGPGARRPALRERPRDA